MKVLVLGATGLLGNAVFRVLSESGGLDVCGSVRAETARAYFTPELAAKLITVGDLRELDDLKSLFAAVRPDVVVNCVAVGRPAPSDPMQMFAIYSLLPQRLAMICAREGARLVQISSDGVFTGRKGAYTESDIPDAVDAYGVAKILGEVSAPHAVTLRSSIIGPELAGGSGLLEWFLRQTGECRCYSRVIFSGLPTFELARVVRDFVLPSETLHGVYHVASEPVSKYELLQIVQTCYGLPIICIPDDGTAMDRSLVADRFAAATGYVAPTWPVLIDRMRTFCFGLAGMQCSRTR